MHQGKLESLVKLFLYSSFFTSQKTKNICLNRLISTTNINLTPEQQVFARDEDGGLSLLEVVQKFKPTMGIIYDYI